MVKYRELGFDTFNEYFNYFMSSILVSNKTYEYFVDWRKVKKDIEKYKKEIFLLNSLRETSSLEEIENELEELLKTYPQITKVIPLLIAERIKNMKINIFDPEIEDFISYEFGKKDYSLEEIRRIIYFCNKTGILKLLKEVKDLYDYLLGIEVGLDTNARKNRSGTIFEKMVISLFERNLSDKYILKPQDKKFSLYKATNIKKKKPKKHDLVIYNKLGEVEYVVEINFYNVTGSKPISIAESYIALDEAAKEKGVKFIWITDGPAWKYMKEPLTRAMEKIDYVINYRMIKKTLKNIII